jgi:hypothetical protein
LCKAPSLLLQQLCCCLRPAGLTAAGQTLGQGQSNLPPGQRLLPQLQQLLLLPAHPKTATPAALPDARSALPTRLYLNAADPSRGLLLLLLLSRLAAAAATTPHLHLSLHHPSAAQQPAAPR